MKYQLITDVIQLIEDFELKNPHNSYPKNITGFKKWLYDDMKEKEAAAVEPDWEGKRQGRSPDSVINTLLVHMSRYAKTYSKSAIHGSDFSTQEEFIYLINLKAFGAMPKMELIKKNIQDKPSGMQIINRLLLQGWIKQETSATDKRSKIIQLTRKGGNALDKQMDKIRRATRIVAGDLAYGEKMELIGLLNKLERFHHRIFLQNIGSAELLDYVSKEHLPVKN